MPKDAAPLPPWPAGAPSFGRVLLRPVSSSDAGMAMALATDPYVCATGTLPPNAGEPEALAWVKRQQGRHSEGRDVLVLRGPPARCCRLDAPEMKAGALNQERSFVPGVSRWRADGTKLTASFGTWRGKEYELRGVEPDHEEKLVLVSRSAEAPGPIWKTVRRHPNNFAATPVEHVLRVPAADVSGIVRVTVTGDLGRNRKVEILAEDAEGRLAVIQTNHWQESDQRRVIAYWDFSPFYASEPLSHQSVFGWIPADRVSGIQSETEHFQPWNRNSTPRSAGLQQGGDLL